ncbi:hypothetical protein [Ensifer aridi]|nr:hypothetical protein [Ensifer aridi]
MHDLDSLARMSDAGSPDRQPSVAELLALLEEIDVVRDTGAIFKSACS